MANNFWQDVWGGAQNLLASGKVYDRRTNTYAPTGVRVPRTVAGVIGQANPIVGVIGGQLANRLPAGSTAWDARLDAPLGVVQQFDQEGAGRTGLLKDWASQQLSGGYNPSVTTGPTQSLPANYGQSTGLLGDWGQAAFDSNVSQAQQGIGGRMDAVQQRLQGQINGAGTAPPMSTLPPVQAQAPWTGLGTSTGNVFSGGALGDWANGSSGGSPRLSYGNGSGAGTGYGASSYANDSWGDVASSFGVGGMSGGARDQAMSMYGPSGRKTRA